MASVVFITGASSGFGYEAALQLATRGHQVFATMRDTKDRNRTTRTAIESQARDANLSLHVLEMDVTAEPSVNSAVQQALAKAGRIDVVINNAGVAAIGLTEAYTPEQFQNVYNVNVCGPVRVNRAVLPSMRQARQGLLIHISSAAGRVAVPGLAPYCASKFALEALADAYRSELQPFGIESVLVEPGIYRTPIFDRLIHPADTERLANYGDSATYVDTVRGVFQAAITGPEALGSEEVTEALIHLVEMTPGQRPFRTVVSKPLQPLLEPYNAAAAGLRPIVAQIFGIPERAG